MPPKEIDSDAINLNKIGKHRIVGGKIVWDPPARIDPALKRMLEKSVRAANKKISEGKLVVKGGKIEPGSEG